MLAVNATMTEAQHEVGKRGEPPLFSWSGKQIKIFKKFRNNFFFIILVRNHLQVCKLTVVSIE